MKPVENPPLAAGLSFGGRVAQVTARELKVEQTVQKPKIKEQVDGVDVKQVSRIKPDISGRPDTLILPGMTEKIWVKKSDKITDKDILGKGVDITYINEETNKPVVKFQKTSVLGSENRTIPMEEVDDYLTSSIYYLDPADDANSMVLYEIAKELRDKKRAITTLVVFREGFDRVGAIIYPEFFEDGSYRMKVHVTKGKVSTAGKLVPPTDIKPEERAGTIETPDIFGGGEPADVISAESEPKKEEIPPPPAKVQESVPPPAVVEKTEPSMPASTDISPGSNVKYKSGLSESDLTNQTGWGKKAYAEGKLVNGHVKSVNKKGIAIVEFNIDGKVRKSYAHLSELELE